MTNIRFSGAVKCPVDAQYDMKYLHEYLMKVGFPYHSVSVIYRHQDIGLHCFFSHDVKDKVTDEVKEYIKRLNATYSINHPKK